MATAPTPPAKPTHPTAPVVSPVTINPPSDLPANTTTTSGNKVTPELSTLGREAEGLMKAFQGTSAPASSDGKSTVVPQPENQTTEPMKTIPVGVINSQNEASTKTVVPVNNQIPENKGASWEYVWLVIAIMVVGSVIIGLRIYRDRQKQPHAANANFGRENSVPKQSATEKGKGNFDFRV